MRYFAYGVLIASIVVLLAYKTEISHTPNEGTKRACMTYASMDHEKEFAPARWEYLKTLGNPNDVEFWYTSCINHHAYPVGGKDNAWIK